MGSFFSRFEAYFSRPVSEKAAKSLANGVEIEIHIKRDSEILETFTFTREEGKNKLLSQPASKPQLIFHIPEQAAEEILSDPTEDIAAIGISMMKRLASPDANRRISIQFRAGVFTFFTKGYFGVITAGGAAFASYLASVGLNGIGAIKAALKKVTGQ